MIFFGEFLFHNSRGLVFVRQKKRKKIIRLPIEQKATLCRNSCSQIEIEFFLLFLIGLQPLLWLWFGFQNKHKFSSNQGHLQMVSWQQFQFCFFFVSFENIIKIIFKKYAQITGRRSRFQYRRF